MLPKKRRLAKKDFIFLFSKGKRAAFPAFNLIYAESGKNGKKKIGFIVSSNVSKKSALRNKLKRRARAIIYRHLKKISEQCFLAFIFKKEALNLSFSELEKEMAAALNEAGLAISSFLEKNGNKK